ncbi:MAG TPA: zinc dependent phospholipase C family protein [Spirochaetota bacterium]|nr:zinc dependent phospholipase C family protein [Spirochaetota bacterium]
MPGIYTHNFIFKRVIDNVLRNRNRSHMMRSLEILFSDKEHLRAGLFGAIGPDIFDFMSVFNRSGIYGNDIAFHLHDSGCVSFADRMIDSVIAQKDSRNEWASVQKAYLLGYISHIVADAVINPFIFYFSGFPSSFSRRETIHYRIANLRFQYNIDNYYLYKSELSVPYTITIDEMLPVSNSGDTAAIWPQVRVLLFESLRRDNPVLFGRFFPSLGDSHIDGDLGRVRLFDRIPANIRYCYKMRRTANERFMRVLDRMCENPLTYSDFFVRYPVPKAVDNDALNIHQARWQYPALQRGYRYESIPMLVKVLIEQITDTWEKLEEAVYNRKNPGPGMIFSLNAYTGEKDALYSDMKTKDIIKLKV